MPEKLIRFGNYRYRQATLTINKVQISYLVHRLVAIAFIPNPENKATVNHINGVKHDNRLENLEWATAKENIRHSFDTNLSHGRKGEMHHAKKLKNEDVLHIYNLANNKVPYTQIMDIYNISKSMITVIKKKQRWGHITQLL